jgi:CDP-paratose 2-epimerase
MFWHYYQNPRAGEVYNAGGGRHSNCSMLEAINEIENISGKKLNYLISDSNRIGDHICYYSDLRKMKNHYPEWDITKTLLDTIQEIYQAWVSRDNIL